MVYTRTYYEFPPFLLANLQAPDVEAMGVSIFVNCTPIIENTDHLINENISARLWIL